MADGSDAFEEFIREIRAYNEATLADIEERLRVLERSRLPNALPLMPVSRDSNGHGIHRERMDFLRRRVERLELRMHAGNVRER